MMGYAGLDGNMTTELFSVDWNSFVITKATMLCDFSYIRTIFENNHYKAGHMGGGTYGDAIRMRSNAAVLDYIAMSES